MNRALREAESGDVAALVALASYSSSDASLNNANVNDVGNWLGPLGAVAADLMLQIFGIAALAFLAPQFVWGGRALRGKSIKYAMWRLVAWPLGTVTVAAGLGLGAWLTGGWALRVEAWLARS